MSSESSRQRFREFREEDKQRRRKRRSTISADSADSSGAVRDRAVSQLLGHLFRLIGRQRGKVAVALAALTLATLFKLAPPLATKVAIDNVLIGTPLPQAWSDYLPLPTDRVQLLVCLAAVVAVVSLLGTTVRIFGRWFATKAVQLVQVAVRRQVYAHMLKLPLHCIYRLKTGGATSLLRNDASGVGDLIFVMLYNPWQAVIQLIGSLAILMWTDWQLLLGALALLPIVFLTHRTWVSQIRPMYREIHARRQAIDSQTTEVFGGIRIVRSFGRLHGEVRRFTRDNNLMVRQQMYVWWWARIIDIVWDVIIPLASVGLLLYGGNRVLQGHLTIGELTMFLVYLTMLLNPLATLASSAATFQNKLSGLDRVLDVLAEPEELTSSRCPAPIAVKHAAGPIVLHDVSFQYPGSSQQVLRGINLEIPAGQICALVGPSGSGKTTLCNLIARFYDPMAGSIELDGTDVRDIRVEDYRSLFAIVEQEVFLFDGTVGENIAYAVPKAQPTEVQQAARAAHAHDFILSLEDGYDTVIGERGVRLSGGQRQRLAIARALLSDPQILILDEATSHVDPESERSIQQSLNTLMRGRTSIVIAHRESTITHANQVVVLDHGSVRQVGSAG